MGTSTHLLLLLLLNVLQQTAAPAGLQVYYYRQPIPPNPNPIQSWKVEGLATWIMQNAFSDNLDCNTTSNNGTGVGWRRTQATLNPNWMQAVTNGRRLALDSFTNSNLGIYTCYDNVTNETVTINITSANPAIQAVSDVVNIEAGSSGQLKVYVSGIPDPSSTDITWFKLGPGGTKTELREPTVNFSSDHRTLLLTNVQDSDGGTYMSNVTQNISLYPSASVFITLAVTRKNGTSSAPVILQQPLSVSLQTLSDARLTCVVGGSPVLNITWMRLDAPLSPNATSSIISYNETTTEGILFIPSIQPSDAGLYQCLATIAGAGSVVSAPAKVVVQSLGFGSSPTATPGVKVTTAPVSETIIVFVSLIIGTSLVAGCLSVVIIICRLKCIGTSNKQQNSPARHIQLQDIIPRNTSPLVGDIDTPHDDVFVRSNDAPRGSRRLRPLDSTSSTAGLLESQNTRHSSTEEDTHSSSANQNTRPPSTEGVRYALPTEGRIATMPNYATVLPSIPRPQSPEHQYAIPSTLSQNAPPQPTTPRQYADPMPVPYLNPSVLNIQASASQSPEPHADPAGGMVAQQRPWYESSSSSLRQLGIPRDEIQPYATTSNLSIPLEPVTEPPPRPPSTLPRSPVPLPYADPAPIRQSLELPNSHRTLSHSMSAV